MRLTGQTDARNGTTSYAYNGADWVTNVVTAAPEPGGGAERWAGLAASLKDCRAFLVTAAGKMPMEVLSKAGLKVIEMEGLIEEGLRAVYANRPIPAPLARRFSGCSAGVSCRGTGTGCG